MGDPKYAVAFGGRKRSIEQEKEPKNPEGSTALIPRVSHGAREKACESSAPLSVPLSICYISSVLPRCGVLPLFAGSLFVALQLSLFVFPLTSSAGHDDYEQKDHSGDTSSDEHG